MATKTWTLTDVEQDVFVEQIALGPDHVEGDATGFAVSATGPFHGVINPTTPSGW